MATLTKIFTGMDKGPERINDNLNALNADAEKALQGAHWTDWTHNGVVIQNGFNEGSGSGQINWRKLIDMNGTVLATQIHGAITKPAYKGEDTAFAQIGGVGVPSRDHTDLNFTQNNGSATGVVHVNMSVKDGDVVLHAVGHPYGQYLDGWTEFNILY